MFTQPGTFKQHDSIAGAYIFDSGGYTAVSDELYEESKVTYKFAFPKNKVALIPKYLSNGNFLFVSVDKNKTVHIGGFIKDAEKVYAEIPVGSLLVSTNSLTVYSVGSRITVSLNGKDLYKFESPVFVRGAVRIYGETNEVFYSCEINELQSTAWTTNTSSNKVEVKTVEINDKTFFKLKSSSSEEAITSQSLSLKPSTVHTLSFTGSGYGKSYVKTSTGTTLLDLTINSQELKRMNLKFTTDSTGSAILSFSTKEQLTVGEVQVEDKPIDTSYIPNESITDPAVRNGSILSYPVKNEFPNKVGSIYIRIQAPDGYDETVTASTSQTILKADNNALKFEYKNKQFLFTVGTKQVSLPVVFSQVKNVEALLSWNEVEMRMTINGATSRRGDAPLLTNKISSLIFADASSVKDSLILEEWALFVSQVNPSTPIKKLLPSAIMQSLFDGGISGQNVTWSEIPVAPIDHSPILVQKEDGETLQKVSFFDFETGKYRNWNKEAFVYDGRSDFVEVAYNNLDEKFRDIAILTEEGEKIGEPYRIDGKRIYFSLYSSLKRVLKNNTLYATYQVNDTYTIDYNIKAVDGYRIDFAKHDGGKRVVYQEGNRYGEHKKLATMVDMNPIQNQNHEGFLYITNTVNRTDSFRVTVTPDRLHADGSSFSTLIIEPLDYQGNFVSHVNLEVKADRGFVARHISQDAVEAQKRSGQYLYQYVAPYIQAKTDGEIIEDHIWITDKDNNIGISYKILLRLSKTPNAYQMKNDEKTKLSAKTKIIDYLLRYEGIEIYEDEKLFSILDLNQDGRVSLDEITLLETNQKDSELTIILNKLEEWEGVYNAATTA